jgi:hypothetical protein
VAASRATGLIVMKIAEKTESVVVLINATTQAHSLQLDGAGGHAPHPAQQRSAG